MSDESAPAGFVIKAVSSTGLAMWVSPPRFGSHRLFGRAASRSAKLNPFAGRPSNDPIAGMAHHLVAPCPVSDSHHVNGTPFESQKLVESGTLLLRNVFRDNGLGPRAA